MCGTRLGSKKNGQHLFKKVFLHLTDTEEPNTVIVTDDESGFSVPISRDELEALREHPSYVIH